jgi:hypothetical protein
LGEASYIRAVTGENATQSSPQLIFLEQEKAASAGQQAARANRILELFFWG